MNDVIHFNLKNKELSNLNHPSLQLRSLAVHNIKMTYAVKRFGVPFRIRRNVTAHVA